jgi:hypothetical protein
MFDTHYTDKKIFLQLKKTLLTLKKENTTSGKESWLSNGKTFFYLRAGDSLSKKQTP